MGRVVLDESDLDDIRLHYPKGENHWTMKRLGEYLGCSWMTIRNYAIRLGLVDDSSYARELAKRKIYYERNREKIRERQRIYYMNRRKDYAHNYYLNHPEYAEKQRRRTNDRYHKMRSQKQKNIIENGNELQGVQGRGEQT